MKRYSLFSAFSVGILMLVCNLNLTSCTSCSKEKKDDAAKEATEIERQYQNQKADDSNNDFESNQNDEEGDPTANIDNIPVITHSDEVLVGIQELRRQVNITRDLVKKHNATGDAKYKHQAEVIYTKARKTQDKLLSAEVAATGTEKMKVNTLMNELDGLMNDIQH